MREQNSLTPQQKRKIWTILDNSTDIETILLKGHLYIEHWINENILDEFQDGQAVLKNFPYLSQKIILLSATGRLNFPLILEQLKTLNKIRNDIAHELFPSAIETKITSIPFEDIYGYETADINLPIKRLTAIIKTLIVQIGNWSDKANHEWAKDAMR